MNYIENLYFTMTEQMKQSTGYENVNKEYGKIYEKIAELLPDETKLMDELFIQTSGLESEYGQMCFKEGFRLAFALAAECFSFYS